MWVIEIDHLPLFDDEEAVCEVVEVCASRADAVAWVRHIYNWADHENYNRTSESWRLRWADGRVSFIRAYEMEVWSAK